MGRMVTWEGHEHLVHGKQSMMDNDCPRAG